MSTTEINTNDPVEVITGNAEPEPATEPTVEQTAEENVEETVEETNADTTEETTETPSEPTTKEVPIDSKIDCIGETDGNVDSLPIRLFKISEYEITRYLEARVLKCRVAAEYVRYDGIPGMPYVIMKTAIPARDVIERIDVGTGTIAEMIRRDGGDIKIKRSFVEDLKPFQFPLMVQDGSILKRPADRDLMIRRGVANKDLEDLIRFSKLTFSYDDNGNPFVIIYLRPERIIAQMLSHRTTKAPYGELTIEDIVGGYLYQDGSREPITWNVVVNCLRDPNFFNAEDVDMSQLFRNAQSN